MLAFFWKTLRAVAPLALLLAASPAWAVDYETFSYPLAAGGSTYLTGIRSDTGPTTLMTGVYTPSGTSATQGIIYVGPITDANAGTWYLLNANSLGASSTALYGPNTVSSGTIRAVGSYKVGASEIDHGLYYEGAADGSGTYKNLDVTISGTAAINTIAHSTHGNLVVGNYNIGPAGQAFIYNINSDSFINLSKPGAVSMTAYGVWDNGDGTYTIAGGFSDIAGHNLGLDRSYLVDYNPANNTFTHFAEYDYNNDSSGDLQTHFDGITTDGNGGYYLTGDWTPNSLEGTQDGALGFFTHVTRNEDGSFSTDPDWTSIGYPGADLTSGNSVLGTTVIGIYLPPGSTVPEGYVAVVPEPGSMGLIALGLGLVGFAARRRKL